LRQIVLQLSEFISGDIGMQQIFALDTEREMKVSNFDLLIVTFQKSGFGKGMKR
jgi:hypothetical protein